MTCVCDHERRADVCFVVNVRLHVAVIGRTRVPSSFGVGVALRSSLVWIVLAVIVPAVRRHWCRCFGRQ